MWNFTIATDKFGISSQQIFLAVVYFILLHLFAKIVVAWYRLRHIPGPWAAGFTRLWLLRIMMRGEWHVASSELFDKYGPVIRIAPNSVSFNNLASYQQVYGTRSKYQKSSWYDPFKLDPSRDNIISTRSTKYHDLLRSKMAAGYSGKDVEGLEDLINDQIGAFLNLVENKYISTNNQFRPMDLALKCQYFTLDLISTIAFGSRNNFGFLKYDKDVNRYLEMAETSMPFMTALSTYPEIATLLQSRFFRRLMPSEKDVIGFGNFIRIAKQVVAERFANPTTRKDMLNSFISHGLSQEEAEGETLITVLAGGDTTATAIRCIMLYLMTSHRVYSLLKDEIYKGISEEKISAPITNAEARSLPYLQAVIKEGLRLHPPIAHMQAMEVPAGGDTISGYFIPAGTQVSNGLWSTVHDKTIFGLDAELFRPERWLEADEKTLKTWNLVFDLVFHAGKWGCLGKPLALMNLNKVLVELLRRFDFTIVNPTTPMKSYNAGVFLQTEMWVTVTRCST